MPSARPILIAVMGPTASGKTVLAEQLAKNLNAVLINADAFQIYRGMDIGTGKPANASDYRLLNVREPNESFGLGEWTQIAQSILIELFRQDRPAIVVGGTGLYIRALFEEYATMAGEPDAELRRRLDATPIEDLRTDLLNRHPDVASGIDMANPLRVRRAFERLETPAAEPVRLPPFARVKFGLNPPIEVLTGRIEHRVHEMVHNGWVQEIEQLRQRGFRREDPAFRAIGYRTLWDHLERKISLDEATATTIVETRRYAKRQRTWLRSEPNLIELPTATEQDAVQFAMERIGSVLM